MKKGEHYGNPPNMKKGEHYGNLQRSSVTSQRKSQSTNSTMSHFDTLNCTKR